MAEGIGPGSGAARTVLVTGGSGFFGGVLKRRLLDDGFRCVNVDLEIDRDTHPNLTSVRGDICDPDVLDRICREHRPEAIFHAAALLTHAVKSQQHLYDNNVQGTEQVARAAESFGVKTVVFTSSNALFGGSALGRPITELDEPHAAEEYGRSKLEGENILLEHRDRFDSVIFRCPNIMDAGRLGLLAILFAFIDEGRRVWVVGDGEVKHQCVYAGDVVDACELALSHGQSGLFNIGSDNVSTFREMFEYVVARANTGARVKQFPKAPAIFAMKWSYRFGVSPLGPYQYRMLTEPFEFNTERIKTELGWQPTLTNSQILDRAYRYYHENKGEILTRTDVSAHNQAAKMGIIRVLKWIS